MRRYNAMAEGGQDTETGICSPQTGRSRSPGGDQQPFGTQDRPVPKNVKAILLIYALSNRRASLHMGGYHAKSVF